jgi:beta-galactosidase
MLGGAASRRPGSRRIPGEIVVPGRELAMHFRTCERSITVSARGLVAVACLALAAASGALADEFAAPLPVGVKVVWEPGDAAREATPHRERVCINGLWRWQPAGEKVARPPADHWGFFKVPGPWPGGGSDMQRDSQTLHAHPAWKAAGIAGLSSAWYERDVAIPVTWAGRRIALNIAFLNSFAAVFVDGRRVGEVRFPGGELDLSRACRPGGQHRLSLLVEALPLKGVMLSYTDSASARMVKGTVPRRGLCGDLYLVSTPTAARLDDVRVDTSVRKGQISFGSALVGLSPGVKYRLRARITRDGRELAEFTSPALGVEDLDRGRYTFTASWKPDRLWDIDRPGHMETLGLSLLDAGGRAVDTAHDVRFGTREFGIDGRDFILNGSRVFLSAVPLDNAQVDASTAGYAGARESLERLKGIGINLVYTHNYGCEPGSHLGFAEILRAPTTSGCWSHSPSPISATTTGRRPTPTGPTDIGTTPISMSGRRRITRRSSSTP